MFSSMIAGLKESILDSVSALQSRRRTDRLVDELVGRRSAQQELDLRITEIKVSLMETDAEYGLTARLRDAAAEVATRLAVVDDAYQRFIQTRVDPLLGKTRNEQLLEMNGQDALPLSHEERVANHQIALGSGALGLSIVGGLFFAPLVLVAGLIGLSAMWYVYVYAYKNFRETKRVGAQQLVCVYLAFLWLGGYATIGALGALLLGVGLKVKAITENRSRNNLISIFQLQPATVWMRHNEVEVEVPFQRIQRGMILVLQAGQAVPVDGVVTAGMALVDQHMLTGEAQPVEKQVGDRVLASTVLVSGRIDVCVEKTGMDTTAGQIVALLNNTTQHKTSAQLKIIENIDRLALPTLVLSGISLPLIGPAGAVSLMGANFTTTTYVSSKLGLLNYLNITANGGILVKDPTALEQLTGVDTIIFDKTGTLTLDQPHVVQIHLFGDLDEKAVLTLAATAEARQTHPIARAILSAAEAQGIQPPIADQVHYEVGYGIKIWTHTTLTCVGSSRFMMMEGITLTEDAQAVTAACQAQGHSVVMVARDAQLVGGIELEPTVRPEARQIIDGLRQRGLSLYIISGDQEAPTARLAQALGMTGYFANTLPEQKAILVEQLQQAGHTVCFIGDGINDAIAMRKANVSVSLRGATTAATDTAQIILMEGNLSRFLYLLSIAQEFTQNMQTNFRFSTTASLFAVAGILFAGFTFAATELLYTASLLGALGIAMRPLLDHQKPGTDADEL